MGDQRECDVTVAATGPLRVAALRTEYGNAVSSRLATTGADTPLGPRRTPPTMFDHRSAAVPALPLRRLSTRGQAKGWTFTNDGLAVLRQNHYAVIATRR
jgi:hypothetical protein